MMLDGATIYLEDQVYDAARGYGRVIKLNENAIEVEFSGRRVVYTMGGVQRGKTYRSLYWNVPFIIAPPKDADHWTIVKTKFNAILAVVNDNI